MLTKLTIHNYKCFVDIELRLKRLNLFVGANSSGKSSAIQALRLCLDNAGKPRGQTVQMASRDRKIGRFSELRSFLTNEKEFFINLSTTEGRLKSSYTFADDTMTLTNVAIESSPATVASALSSMPMFYLPANRESARDVFPMNMETESPLGPSGEYVIDYFAHHSGDVLDDSLIYDKSLKTLEGQVNYWLRQLTGYTLQVRPQGETYIVRYKNIYGREIRPYHVGTGVSFISAMLIVSLSIPEGGLVIIENPEIHLHPKAQALAMDFFCMIASTERQLMIETHSDHLFNGVRRLIAQKKILVDDASILFFRLHDMQESRPVHVELTEKGRMVTYEKGLFDQFDDDLDILLQVK